MTAVRVEEEQNRVVVTFSIFLVLNKQVTAMLPPEGSVPSSWVKGTRAVVFEAAVCVVAVPLPILKDNITVRHMHDRVIAARCDC